MKKIFALSFLSLLVLSGCSNVNVNAEQPKNIGFPLEYRLNAVGIDNAVTLTATITPSNATDKRVTWTISDSTKLGFKTDPGTGLTALVYAKGTFNNNATVTATTTDGGFTAVSTFTTYLVPQTIQIDYGTNAVSEGVVDGSTQYVNVGDVKILSGRYWHTTEIDSAKVPATDQDATITFTNPSYLTAVPRESMVYDLEFLMAGTVVATIEYTGDKGVFANKTVTFVITEPSVPAQGISVDQPTYEF